MIVITQRKAAHSSPWTIGMAVLLERWTVAPDQVQSKTSGKKLGRGSRFQIHSKIVQISYTCVYSILYYIYIYADHSSNIFKLFRPCLKNKCWSRVAFLHLGSLFPAAWQWLLFKRGNVLTLQNPSAKQKKDPKKRFNIQRYFEISSNG